MRTTIQNLVALNRKLKTDGFIIPTISAKKIDHLWEKIQAKIIEITLEQVSDMTKYHTIALNSDVISVC